MAKQTQTIRREIADELFECVWPLCYFDAKRVNVLPLIGLILLFIVLE